MKRSSLSAQVSHDSQPGRLFTSISAAIGSKITFWRDSKFFFFASLIILVVSMSDDY